MDLIEFKPQRKERMAMSLMSSGPSSNFYRSQRLRLHYLDWGNHHLPPLILLHGGMDHGRSWDQVALRLRDKWRVIVPELRGHGDSEWTSDGDYSMAGYVYDLAQLVHQQGLAPVTIVAHSLGGNISIRYSALYPDNVRKLVAIEGLGPSPERIAEEAKKSPADKLREWIERKRQLSARQAKRYPSLEEAAARMRDKNGHLSKEMAEHLTLYGVNQNEDGTYSWKFDNYCRAWPPTDMPQAALEGLWGAIKCPTLLVYGNESWASNPMKDGRIKAFNNDPQVVDFDRAGHWVHHDRFDDFVTLVENFVA
jgi:pimeloyl-ACP methyl ester carboxylesterase